MGEWCECGGGVGAEVVFAREQVDQGAGLGALYGLERLFCLGAIDAHAHQGGIDGLFVGRKADFVDLGVDGGALALDHVDGLAVPLGRLRQVALVFSNAPPVVEHEPVDFAVVACDGDGQQAVDVGLRLLPAPEFEPAFGQQISPWQLGPGPVVEPLQGGAAENLVEPAAQAKVMVAFEQGRRLGVLPQGDMAARQGKDAVWGVVVKQRKRRRHAGEHLHLALGLGALANKGVGEHQGGEGLQGKVAVVGVFFLDPVEHAIGLGNGARVVAPFEQCFSAHQTQRRRGIVQAKQPGALIAGSDLFFQLRQTVKETVVALGFGVGKAQGVQVAGAQLLPGSLRL